jgi:hypothetical protein
MAARSPTPVVSGFSRTPGTIVSTGGSCEKSGIGSLAVRFWKAAFLRANIVMARLYATSVVSQISRRIAS